MQSRLFRANQRHCGDGENISWLYATMISLRLRQKIEKVLSKLQQPLPIHTTKDGLSKFSAYTEIVDGIQSDPTPTLTNKASRIKILLDQSPTQPSLTQNQIIPRTTCKFCAMPETMTPKNNTPQYTTYAAATNRNSAQIITSTNAQPTTIQTQHLTQQRGHHNDVRRCKNFSH